MFGRNARLTPFISGLLNSFGAFQPFYETDLLSHVSPSSISWIGSTQVFCLMAIGVIIGPLFDAGYCRLLVLVGTFLETAGFMLTSISTEYWQIFLAQGICIGLGMSCLNIPSIAIVPMYFKKRRAMAMALATVGSGIGSVVNPILFRTLQHNLGFGWATRIMGFISLVMGAFALAVIRRPAPPSSTQSTTEKRKQISLKMLIDPPALGDKHYLLFCAGQFFMNLAFFEQGYYLEGYAVAHGLRGANLARFLLPISSASSIPGRMVPSIIADHIGSLNTYVFVCWFSCASVLYWISVVNVAGNISFSVLWGFFSGGLVAMGPIVLTSITVDLGRLGTRLGMVSILKGVGSLIGPPIAGAILSGTRRYLGIQLFSGCSLFFNAILVFVLRMQVIKAVKS